MRATSQLIGRVRAALGWATADRREEAKGKLQELDDNPSDSPKAPQGEVLDEAELHVRSDHGDLAPSAEPGDRAPKTPPTAG